MTDEEIEKRAEEYTSQFYGKSSLFSFSDIENAYIAGAKENASKWHYPSNGEYPEKEKKVYAIVRKGLRVSDEFAFWQIETDSVCDMAMWVDCFGKRIDVECWQYLPEPPMEEE